MSRECGAHGKKVNMCWGLVRKHEGKANFSMNIHLTQYCTGDKIEKNEMGWACGAYG